MSDMNPVSIPGPYPSPACRHGRVDFDHCKECRDDRREKDKALKILNENHRARIIESCDKHKEIGPLDDGFQYFWIKDRGAMSATDLRIIADELDRRNKDWQEQIERDLNRLNEDEFLSTAEDV